MERDVKGRIGEKVDAERHGDPSSPFQLKKTPQKD
jgi:hypothetical protein